MCSLSACTCARSSSNSLLTISCWSSYYRILIINLRYLLVSSSVDFVALSLALALSQRDSEHGASYMKKMVLCRALCDVKALAPAYRFGDKGLDSLLKLQVRNWAIFFTRTKQLSQNQWDTDLQALST